MPWIGNDTLVLAETSTVNTRSFGVAAAETEGEPKPVFDSSGLNMIPPDPEEDEDETEGEPNSETHIDLRRELGLGLGLYELQPISGKRRQLRVHMNALGIPIEGDQFYPNVLRGPDAPEDFSQPLQLLAQSVRFTDPITGTSTAPASSRSGSATTTGSSASR